MRAFERIGSFVSQWWWELIDLLAPQPLEQARPQTVQGAAYVLIGACLLAAFVPWWSGHGSRSAPVTEVTPDWPPTFEGRPLEPLPLSADERRFMQAAAGAVQRFTDGSREIVMRWVTQPTRRLHPASDCYRGLGYTVGVAQITRTDDGEQWRCFDVHRGKDGRDDRHVCERIVDHDGRAWTDVSSWYWAASLEQSQGPWLVTTVASVEAAP